MTEYEIEKTKNIPVIADVDVLVCGGGPAGIGAAVCAASMGVKTLVVEMFDCLGGIATSGMMSHWGGASSSIVMLEIFRRTREKCNVLGWADENSAEIAQIHHEAQKIALDEFVAEVGADVLFYTKVCGVKMNGNRIEGVFVENKSGRGFIKAKIIVDATGDGDVAYYAGVPFYKGRESDGKMQPVSVMFKLGGVDYSRAVFPHCFEASIPLDNGEELQSLGKKLLPFPAGHVLLYRQPTPGTVCCNMTNAIDVDGTDARSLSNALMQCRSQLEPIIDFLHKNAPGYENCWLMSTGPLIGVRETRHFEGVERLEKEDILNARYFDNWIVRHAYFNFDVHNMSGNGLDETGVQDKFGQTRGYTIPYGCLLPKTVEGLLLSGRNISGSHIAHSNFRIMSVCIALGEAAGAASALCVKNKLASLKDVNVSGIQKAVTGAKFNK
ncbi:MAG: FAD-dependent oxidoreductase [Clostridiales bacterium]|nr:FAD-dependent oxidoreductase [Clostridiales bacterium]